MNPTEPLARFSARVQHATNGCWIWQGASVKGRGQIYVNGKNMLATRFAYQQFKGEIPEGMYVCHTCDDPSCVNPNHLWLGTARDNWQDARRKRRALQGIKREVCPQGHEYSGRECLTCRDARNKKRDHRAYRLAAQARRDAEVIALRTRVAELEAALLGLLHEDGGSWGYSASHPKCHAMRAALRLSGNKSPQCFSTKETDRG